MTVCSYIYWLLMLAYCRVSKNCGHFPVPVGYPKFISKEFCFWQVSVMFMGQKHIGVLSYWQT